MLLKLNWSNLNKFVEDKAKHVGGTKLFELA